MIGIIYKLTSPSGKIYIGLTTKRLSDRLKKHQRDAYIYNHKMSSSIKKYGISAFKVEVIDFFDTHENGMYLEKKYIAEYNSKCNGLNCTDGGDGAIGCNISEEHKEKIRLKLKGKKRPIHVMEALRKGRAKYKVTDEVREKIGLAAKGRIPWNKGKKLPQISMFLSGRKASAETKLKQSIAKKGNNNPKYWLGKKRNTPWMFGNKNGIKKNKIEEDIKYAI